LYGGTTDSLGDGAAELYSVPVPLSFYSSFLDGQVAVLYTGSNMGNDGVCVDYTRFTITGEIAPVPEPATMLLLGFGLVGLAGFRRLTKN
jgi:hypothetical protein